MIFRPAVLTAEEERLRLEVREFLAAELPPDFRPGLGLGGRHDPEFSRTLAARGWVGMAIPREYGGQGSTQVERFVVVEELLAAGAPTLAHWVAERQTAPTLLTFGTEEQRRWFLPRIASGECWFSLGMSEPDAGSDLASVRTAATKVDGGWVLNGTKIWTSAAHLNHFFVVLCRTSPSDDRHGGLSQLIVDLHAPGLKVSPIHYLDGGHHFNEVVFTDVFVPDDRVLGEVGSGWGQVTSELAYERSGPDRYLSTFGLLAAFVREFGPTVDDAQRAAVGRASAKLWTIRQLSLAVARSLERGAAPAVESALVKDIGTVYEQEVVEALRQVAGQEIDPGAAGLFERLLAEAVQTAPSFTLRGGTTEVLRSIAAKGLSAQDRTVGASERSAVPSDADLVAEAVGEVLAARCTQEVVTAAENTGWAPELWATVADGGFPWVSVPEGTAGDAAGGVAVGGSVAEACAVLEQVGRYAAPLPVAETGLLGGWLLAAAGLEVPSGPVTTAPTAGWSGMITDPMPAGTAPQGRGSGSDAATGSDGARPRASVSVRRDGGGWVATGTVRRVPWARAAARIVLLADSPDGLHVVALDPASLRIEPGVNLAGEPRDRVHLDDVAVTEIAPAPEGVDHDALLLRGALSRAALIAGAAGRVLDITVAYTNAREQFGRPVARFQAVAAHLVRLAEQTEAVRMAARVAAANTGGAPSPFDVAAAKTVASEAAGLIAAAAHQATGAMGMTREYELGQLTRRLWSWREEYGGERVWSTRLGAWLTDFDTMWPAIARGAVG